MNLLKTFLLSILSLFSVCVFTQASHAQDDDIFPRGDINLYPWQTPDKSRPEEYCQSYGYVDYAQVEIDFKKINNQIFEITCKNKQSWMYGQEHAETRYFNNYTLSVNNPLGDGHEYSAYSQNLTDYCSIAEYPGNITDLPNYTDYITFTPIKIEGEGRLQINCINQASGQLAQLEIYYKKENPPTSQPPQPPTLTPTPQIEGCMDTLATNYNANATVHVQNLCEYPAIHTPQDITASFEKSQVTIGATTWTLRFNLNVSDATLDPNTVQNWEKFTAISATTDDKTITLTLRQFDDQRLDVECTNYEVTIPANAIRTPNGDTNANPISGNFEVIGCNNTNTNNNQNNTGTGQIQQIEQKYTSNMNDNAFYVRLFDIDDKGNQHLNLGSLIFVLGFSTFFLVVFFLLFAFIKNSFLGKSKR